MENNKYPAYSELIRLMDVPGVAEGGRFILDMDVCVIGRGVDCNLNIPMKIVSRIHAKIERSDLYYFIIDNNSQNGTFLNGIEIEKGVYYRLKDGDEIGFGSNILAFRFIDNNATLPKRLVFDEGRFIFRIGVAEVPLTPSEFKFLFFLYQRSGRLCERYECIRAVWGDTADRIDMNDQLDNLHFRVRRKLQSISHDIEYIKVRKGHGFILVVLPIPLV